MKLGLVTYENDDPARNVILVSRVLDQEESPSPGIDLITGELVFLSACDDDDASCCVLDRLLTGSKLIRVEGDFGESKGKYEIIREESVIKVVGNVGMNNLNYQISFTGDAIKLTGDGGKSYINCTIARSANTITVDGDTGKHFRGYNCAFENGNTYCAGIVITPEDNTLRITGKHLKDHVNFSVTRIENSTRVIGDTGAANSNLTFAAEGNAINVTGNYGFKKVNYTLSKKEQSQRLIGKTGKHAANFVITYE